MKLYRAGEPTQGVAYWSATAQEAKKLGPDLAVHEAELSTTARIHQMPIGKQRIRTSFGKLRDRADVVVFAAKDGTYEYVVLNPHVLRILQ